MLQEIEVGGFVTDLDSLETRKRGTFAMVEMDLWRSDCRCLQWKSSAAAREEAGTPELQAKL